VCCFPFVRLSALAFVCLCPFKQIYLMASVTMAEAIEMRSKLEKEEADSDQLSDILHQLLEREISLKTVIDSKIGMAVKGLRKHDKVGKLALDLTSRWKKLVASTSNSPAPPAKSADPAPPKKAPPPKSAAPIGEKRTKVRELLEKAIQNKDTCPSKDTAHGLAAEIEEALFAHFKGVTDQYTAMVKSVKFNLADPKNPDFRGRVVSGAIPPAQVPTLSSSQMAGKDKIEQMKQAVQGKAFQMELFKMNDVQETTDMFECGKCHERKTTFYQKQTRSADEPMTIFITCKACGNEWRD